MNRAGIQNPVGMAGVRLEAKIHIVTGAVTSAHNIVKCCNRSGLDVCDIVLESLASGEAVLPEKKKNWGRHCWIWAAAPPIWPSSRDKNIRHTFVLALGGNNLTNDIAIGCGRPMRMRKRSRPATAPACRKVSAPTIRSKFPEWEDAKPRKLPRQILGEILEPRMEEIFTLAKREIYRAGLWKTVFHSGLVLTGGTSLLEGITEIAESIFNLPTRLGKPQGITGLVDVVNNPMYATGVGLVLYGAKNQTEKKFRIRDAHIFNRIMSQMKRWFKDVV